MRDPATVSNGSAMSDSDVEIVREGDGEKRLVSVRDLQCGAGGARRDATGDEELELVDFKLDEAILNLPHLRPDCPVHAFIARGAGAQSNAQSCPQCFCFVCDKPASECVRWESASPADDGSGHCNAFSSGKTLKPNAWDRARLAARLSTRRRAPEAPVEKHARAPRAAASPPRYVAPDGVRVKRECSPDRGPLLQLTPEEEEDLNRRARAAYVEAHRQRRVKELQQAQESSEGGQLGHAARAPAHVASGRRGGGYRTNVCKRCGRVGHSDKKCFYRKTIWQEMEEKEEQERQRAAQAEQQRKERCAQSKRLAEEARAAAAESQERPRTPEGSAPRRDGGASGGRGRQGSGGASPAAERRGSPGEAGRRGSNPFSRSSQAEWASLCAKVAAVERAEEAARLRTDGAGGAEGSGDARRESARSAQGRGAAGAGGAATQSPAVRGSPPLKSHTPPPPSDPGGAGRSGTPRTVRDGAAAAVVARESPGVLPLTPPRTAHACVIVVDSSPECAKTTRRSASRGPARSRGGLSNAGAQQPAIVLEVDSSPERPPAKRQRVRESPGAGARGRKHADIVVEDSRGTEDVQGAGVGPGRPRKEAGGGQRKSGRARRLPAKLRDAGEDHAS
ncbi:unnamed protein product [Pedinophyceae sp. YPF-701]|nr:unnamed protein product [Pedinophyceae sp. YPF-701]